MIIFNLKRRRELMGPDDGGVALISAMLFIVIMAGLSLVLLSVVMSQLTPTYLAQKSTATVSAAQAGVQAALGQLRTAASVNAQTGRLSGDLSKLPCTLSASVDGTGTGTGVRYEVGITYFTQDPTGHDAAWFAANDLTCSPSAGLTVQPTHALIISLGDGPAIPGRAATFGDRTITAVYTFSLSNINIPGGRIFNSNKQFCLQASGLTAGSTVKFVKASACTDNPTQLWLYSNTYQIKLASSTGAGLCITGPMQAGGGTANALLQSCRTAADAARWNQLWSWTGDYTWRGQQSQIAQGTSNFCLATGAGDGADLTGKLLLAADGCQGTFIPQPEVGAGNAGYGTRQIVNYKEFGRCADVTGENINASWLISYPCKQDPTGTGTFLKWNHKWYYTEPSLGQPSKTGPIYVNYLDNTGSKYCLQSPLKSGGYPVFAFCNGSASQNWTRNGDTGQYSTSYVFVDSAGRCLSANAADPDGAWSRLVVTACDGTLAQKWNSPPLATEPGIDGYREVTP